MRLGQQLLLACLPTKVAKVSEAVNGIATMIALGLYLRSVCSRC